MVSLKLALTLLPLAIANTYVTPFADGSDGWQDAFDQAKGLFPSASREMSLICSALVSQMTLEEKLNITQQSISAAPVGAVPRLGYTGLVYADGSEGIRGAPFASAFDVALNCKQVLN